MWYYDVVRLLKRNVMDWTVRGSNPVGGEIFRTHPDRSWGQPSNAKEFKHQNINRGSAVRGIKVFKNSNGRYE
jgi:hypothetical protein